MAVTAPPASKEQVGPASIAGHGRGEVPEIASELIFRRSADEKVLWRGQPDWRTFASSAFHTKSLAVYLMLLVAFAYATGGLPSAITIAVMGAVALLILLGLAWLSAKKASYILTNQRIVMVIGVAIEKRISIPLKQIASADLKLHGRKGHGSVALDIAGDQPLSYILLWPHSRPLHFASPKPLLRALPDAEQFSRLLAEAVAEVQSAEPNLIQVNDGQPALQHRAIDDIEAGTKGAPA
ncbi:MAG: photosynthetic complex putative assembly protein PuhB [Pseudomonadota bacterium]